MNKIDVMQVTETATQSCSLVVNKFTGLTAKRNAVK